MVMVHLQKEMLLQLAKLNAKEITKIVDVNPYKFGR